MQSSDICQYILALIAYHIVRRNLVNFKFRLTVCCLTYTIDSPSVSSRILIKIIPIIFVAEASTLSIEAQLDPIAGDPLRYFRPGRFRPLGAPPFPYPSLHR